MGLADGIRKHGFRKWYERELIASHAHLVLTFLLCDRPVRRLRAVQPLAPAAEQIVDLGAVLLFSVVGVWALRRYLYLLMHAEATANQAVCPHCKTYARFTLIAEGEPHRGEVRVRCRHCEHQWPIEE